MRLAFCLFKYFPFGGMQRDFLRIARECRDRGHTIHVYTMSWEGDAEPGFQVHLINASGRQNHSRIVSYIQQLQQALQQEQYDCVVGFNKMPGLDWYYAADVCYQKRAHEKHGLLYRLLPRYRQLVALERQVFSAGQHTQILAISPFTQSEFSAYYQTEAARFHLLPPGIARDRLVPANAEEIRARVRQQYQLTVNDLLLLMVGSGFKTKGVDRAVHALAALPLALRTRCRLFVIGQDDAQPFQRLAGKLGIAGRVRFLGGRADVAHFYLAADLLVHPAYHENTGTVLLEALTSSLPVITIDVCGYAHYIKNANAGEVLASPFKQPDFNKALANMLLSPHLKKLGANGYAFAKEADIYSMPIKAADLLESSRAVFGAESRTFNEMMQLKGEVFRVQPGRETLRVRLEDKHFFIKKHTGVGWREIFKNLLQLKKPVLGARNERVAIEKLQALGVAVPQVIAYGERGKNPATRHSFILLQELVPVVSLEQLVEQWRTTPPSIVFKRQLIKEVARIARVMHENGINHRDFYLCHFLMDTAHVNAEPKLYLIDLHRAELREKIPERWRIKDLAGLYFSSINSGFTKRDYLRFMRYYRDMSLRDIAMLENKRWEQVKWRGERLYREHH